ncbi:hypothetical protein C2845_PM06G19090 [Panicum miliaceum]|uniref:Uncharacterized protein n=1 Tax=Panicum miliaceum TaxID=4540 RepID=A0A3L6R828_PANMI|nr:hypothetical protein C2845_PM06G19090 [Panicum miliaceum]
MEFYHQYFSGGGGYSAKEKRPPLKRGQLKRQIVRTISKFVVPSGGGPQVQKRTEQQLMIESRAFHGSWVHVRFTALALQRLVRCVVVKQLE